MAFRKFVEKITKPVEELDREKIKRFSDEVGARPLSSLDTREHVRVAGEISSVRIVPRAGAPSLEATLNDGRGSVTAIFLGRRKIAGMSPGRKIVLEGVVGHDAGRYVVLNPVYELR